jgi:glycosyltransferase involved in cell wall biosynthesis
VADLLPKLNIESADIFYSFAYTGLKPMQKLKPRVKKILYQMDPGLEEEILVQEEYRKAGISSTSWQPAPQVYWDNWKKELVISDKIVVNSAWSKAALMKQGIPEEKIAIVPLPYTIPTSAYDFKREYPEKFTKERPLRALFLGTLTVRKGFHRVLEVAKALKDEPVEFYLVGQKEFDFDAGKNVKFFGHVSREDTIEFYKKSDVFLFPTLSDGFGLTQVEALSWKLPVVASRFCAEVVEDGKSGVVLAENSIECLTSVISLYLNNPELLQTMSSFALERAEKFSSEVFANCLVKLSGG